MMLDDAAEKKLNHTYPECSGVPGRRPYHWSFVTQSLFYMFLLTSPLNVYGLGTGGFNYRFSRIFLIFSALALIIERFVKMRNLFFRLLPFEYLIGIYCTLALLSSFYVSNYDAFYTRFFQLIECILILYVIRMFTKEKGYWLKSIHVYLLSSIPVLLASFYQIINVLRGNLSGTVLPFPSFLLLERYAELDNWQYFGGIVNGISRVPSTFADPNTLAGYCVSLIPFAIMVVLISNKNRMILWKTLLNLIILLGLVVMVIASVSKTGFLCMVLGILFLGKYAFMKLSAKQKRWRNIIVILIIVFGVFYGLRIADYIVNRLSYGDSGHIEYSLSAWKEYFAGSLLIGQGFGQYESVSAHVIVITALIELGIFGGVIVFFITMQPFAYIKYLSRLSLRMNYEPLVKKWFFFMSASLASCIAVVLGLYLYDFWLHPFTWISFSLLMSLVSLTKYEFKQNVFSNL